MLRAPSWTRKIKADGVSLDPENQSWSLGACQDGWSQPWPGPPDSMKSNPKEPKIHWKNKKKQSLRHYSGLVRPMAQVPIDCQTLVFWVFPMLFLFFLGIWGLGQGSKAGTACWQAPGLQGLWSGSGQPPGLATGSGSSCLAAPGIHASIGFMKGLKHQRRRP